MADIAKYFGQQKINFSSLVQAAAINLIQSDMGDKRFIYYQSRLRPVWLSISGSCKFVFSPRGWEQVVSLYSTF